MYEKYFSFKYKPFELIPNPDFLFLSSSHRKAITYLDYGIKEKIGFILLTGEIGSGKTTIIRSLIKNLASTVKLSKINNTKVSSEQLISLINEDFGLDIKGKDKTILLSELNGFLIDQYAKGFQPVLLIDEAQNLTPDLLEEIRLLSNLETDRTKLIQIILVGQPELKKTLALPNLRQLRQRISLSFHINALTIEETGEYIKHRLTIAGNPDVINFKGDMLPIIYQFSKGIPRLINIICDYALLVTYTEGEKEVDADTLKEVVQDLKSYNYWNESQDVVYEASYKDEYSGLLQIEKKLTSKLTKIEEGIAQLLKSDNLSERVAGLERELKVNSNTMIGLLNRIHKLEQALDVSNIDRDIL